MNKIPHIIPISKLNRGYASDVLKKVKDNNETTLIVKNNKPVAVIISVNLYNSMAINSGLSKINESCKKHNGAGILHKYAKPEYIGKEEELYHQALDVKYGK